MKQGCSLGHSRVFPPFPRACRYDPLRKMRVSFIETLKRSGWPHLENHTITDGVTVLASLDSKYLAFDVGASSLRSPSFSPYRVK